MDNNPADDNIEIMEAAGFSRLVTPPAYVPVSYSYVEITVQLSDRDQVMVRREYDPALIAPGAVLDSLVGAVRGHLHARGVLTGP